MSPPDCCLRHSVIVQFDVFKVGHVKHCPAGTGLFVVQVLSVPDPVVTLMEKEWCSVDVTCAH